MYGLYGEPPIEIREGIYTIDEEGRVFNIRKQYYIAQTVVGDYLTVNMKHGDTINRRAVHKLVATIFIINPYNCKWIIHKNKNMHDNHYMNLEWVDYKTFKRHKTTIKHTMTRHIHSESFLSKIKDYEIPDKFKRN